MYLDYKVPVISILVVMNVMLSPTSVVLIDIVRVRLLLQVEDWSGSVHLCFTVVVTVVVVDSLELELDEEYPDGDLAGGVPVL